MRSQQIMVTVPEVNYHSSYDDTWELHGVGVRFGFEF